MSIDDKKLANYPTVEFIRAIDILKNPHMYCMTQKHVAHAADYYGGLITAQCIMNLENKMGRGMCGVKGCQLRYNEHKDVLLLEINHPAEQLKDVPGLQKYLEDVQEQLVKDGFDGVAFKKAGGFYEKN